MQNDGSVTAQQVLVELEQNASVVWRVHPGAAVQAVLEPLAEAMAQLPPPRAITALLGASHEELDDPWK